MITTLLFLLKVMVIQAILYILYALKFHKSGNHSVNRFYLIVALVISFVIPLLSFPAISEYSNETVHEITNWYEVTDQTLSESISVFVPVKTSNTINYYKAIGIGLFIVITTFFLLKVLISHFQLLKITREAKAITINNQNVFIADIDIPFSYFKKIFIPERLIKAPQFDVILNHELAHVKYWHSLDRLFLEFLTAIFWFNPFHYLYRRKLVETHEFQADENTICRDRDVARYQETLYSELHSNFSIASVNHFNFNTIKNRIKMMNQPKKQSKWQYLILLPVIALLAFSFAKKENSPTSLIDPELDELFESVIHLSDVYTPSIQPLKNSELVRLTSTFGKRMHPILKVMRMHEGVDFATNIGNQVMATANGTVIKVDNIINGFGKHIVIDHNGLYQTKYAQLSEFKVIEGQRVKRGDIIALTGNSGVSTGPHLHYEVRDSEGEALDPLHYIKDYNYKEEVPDGKSNKMNLGNSEGKIRVLIDPGHGGNDKGMKSFDKTESQVTLQVAQLVNDYFKNLDEVEIQLTRSVDNNVTLEERVSNTNNADLFISLHVETHEYEDEDRLIAIYNDSNEFTAQSKYFSELIANEFKEIDKIVRLGYSTGFYVLKNTRCPSVMLSVGYFSNPDSEKYLNSEEGINEIATKLSEAILASI